MDFRFTVFSIFNPQRNEWVEAGEIKPGDPRGSMSQNKPDGSRDVYLFECAPDDSHSTIYKSTEGTDAAIGSTRLVITEGLELVKELRKGDEPYRLTVGTDISSQRTIVRFTHK